MKVRPRSEISRDCAHVVVNTHGHGTGRYDRVGVCRQRFFQCLVEILCLVTDRSLIDDFPAQLSERDSEERRSRIANVPGRDLGRSRIHDFFAGGNQGNSRSTRYRKTRDTESSRSQHMHGRNRFACVKDLGPDAKIIARRSKILPWLDL